MADEDRARRGDVLELRVHGVSGTPPTDLLDRPLVEQVDGDRIAGFYRPRLAVERRDDGPNPFAPTQPGAPELASYNWGGLTSGTAARALWLLLLPLTLVNVAPRARPAGGNSSDRSAHCLWYFSRLLALALTCLYITTGVGAGMDLVSWQCSNGTLCSGAEPDFVFHDISYENRLSIEHMLLVGLLVPLVQLLLLGLIARRTANRYEKRVFDFGPVPGPTRAPTRRRGPAETALDSPDMWHNAVPVQRLRTLHLQAGVAIIVFSVAMVGEHWWSLVPLAVFGYAAVAPACRSFTRHAPSLRWQWIERSVWVVLGVAGGVQVIGLAFFHWVDAGYLTSLTRSGSGRSANAEAVNQVHRTPLGGLPHYADTVLAVCAVALVALLGVVVAVGWARRAEVTGDTGEHEPLTPPLAGFATAVFAALGTFLAASFSAGTYMFVATWLGTGSLKPGYAQIASAYGDFTVPAAVGSANLAFAFAAAALLIIVVAAGVAVLVTFLRRPGSRDYFAADYPDADPDSARGVSIRRAMLLGRVVDSSSRVIAALVLSGGAIVVWFAVRLALDGGDAPDHVFGRIESGWRSAASIGAAGTYLAIFTLLGLVSLGAIAFRQPQARRTVGILWDVAAFWPRMCHPLAAPCYAERTVPDLVTYVSAYRAHNPDHGIVLAAHSQGTVISAAVIAQLDTYDHMPQATVKVVPRLAYLSFGCVLRRLYGRFFPVYFGPAQLYRLETALGGGSGSMPRWINLWRYTDYLGGQVTAGPGQVVPEHPARPTVPIVARLPQAGPTSWEWHCPDPPSFGPSDGETTAPGSGRHSDFWADESGYFQLAAAELAQRVRAAGP